MVVNTAASTAAVSAERVQAASQTKLGTAMLKQGLEAEQGAVQLAAQATTNQAKANPPANGRGQIVDIWA